VEGRKTRLVKYADGSSSLRASTTVCVGRRYRRRPNGNWSEALTRRTGQISAVGAKISPDLAVALRLGAMAMGKAMRVAQKLMYACLPFGGSQVKNPGQHIISELL
jgi:hypothetical protein